MLHIIERCEPDIGDPLLAEMFEARRRVFVDLLRWDLPVQGGRFEIDGFDDPRAIYLIAADRAGAHLASARLLPTTYPHILGTLYPQLCEDGVPAGPHIWEVTRFCLERRVPAALRRVARNTLVAGLAEFALGRRITHYTGVAEFGWLQQILAFGWTCRPLGMPRSVGGMLLGALEIEIDAETPAKLALNNIHLHNFAREELRDAA